MRKILKNNRKSKRMNGVSKGKIGTALPIMDKNGNTLAVGDRIRYSEYEGILLYNPAWKRYGVAIDGSLWYGDDPYNIDSYGKFMDIPMDNGARMEIEKL